MPTYSDDDILTTAQAGAVVKFHRRTILAWISSGRLKAMRPKTSNDRGHYRIRYGDLMEALKSDPR